MMIENMTNIVKEINEIRQSFLEIHQQLKSIPSFQSLHGGSLKSEWELGNKVAESQTVKFPLTESFNCAIVGGSNNGKTTILSEMFEPLAKRGWLVTEVKDTTSQALRISYEPDPKKVDEVRLHSWDYSQIKALVDSVQAENGKDKVSIHFDDSKECVEIDGTNATFTDKQGFHFPLKQTLRPLPTPIASITSLARDRNFITALTVKESSATMKKGPILSIKSVAFEALALRAIVKQVDLRDHFSEIFKWAKEPKGKSALANLVFLDTPGLNVGFSPNDEVLRHVLKRKNQQIIVELMKQDELDIIIHLVLPNRESSFSELWKAISEQCGAEQLSDLEDRLILAMNGFNMYLTEPDLTKNWDNPKGDHFAVSIEENVLKKMCEAGAIRPARFCFLDSFTQVNERSKRFAEGVDYSSFYAKHKETLKSWCSEEAPCFKTLRRLNLMTLKSFRENLVAVCDSTDRGQGFLVRQILDLIGENGPKLKARKYLVRSRLVDAARKIRDGLLRYYSSDGQLNFRVIHDVVCSCLGSAGITADNLESIEKFALDNHMDAKAEGAVPAPGKAVDPARWVEQSLRAVKAQLLAVLKTKSNLDEPSWRHFERYFDNRYEVWERNAGFHGANFPVPTQQRPTGAELLKHALKLQVREMLYQLLVDSTQVASHNVAQEPQDRADIQNAIQRLNELLKRVDALCQTLGVMP